MKKSRIEQRTPLKRTKIKPISDKQREINRLWNKITDEVCEELDYKCQWCGWTGQRFYPSELSYLDGHHIIKRRFGNHEKSNCFICHRKCHQHIHSKGIDVREYKEE